MALPVDGEGASRIAGEGVVLGVGEGTVFGEVAEGPGGLEKSVQPFQSDWQKDLSQKQI